MKTDAQLWYNSLLFAYIFMHTLKYGILNLNLSDNIVRQLIRLLSFYSSTSVLSAKHAPVIACVRKLPKDVDRAKEI